MKFLTRAHLHPHHHHVGQARGLHRGMLRHIGVTQDMKDEAVTKAATLGTAFALGVVQGRMGGMPEQSGIPLDAAVGVAGTLAEFVIPQGWKTTRRISSGVGLGGLSVLARYLGESVGQKLRTQAGLMTGKPATNRVMTAGGTRYDARAGSYSPDALRAALHG